MSQKNSFVKKGQFYRSLVATALIANGIFQFVAPVLAEGGAGGQTINNTATATYEDPNNPGETINTTSNTVEVTIAEVAGITVTPANTEFTDSGDQNGDSKINIGDKVYYNYTVTNVGNDPTKFRIPDQPTVTGPATLTTVDAPDNPGTTDGPVEISYDGGTTWETVATGGTTTRSIDPDQSVLVRVAVEVQPGAQSGEIIAVKLGETPGDEQNIPRSSDGGDVFTVDNTLANSNGTLPDGEVDGDPSNGVREASATLEAVVDDDLKTYTLAKVLKVRSGYTPAGAAGPSEDTVTYDLSLEVENSDPTGNGISPAPLETTAIDLDGQVEQRILVSDAIPVGTTLTSVVVPPGWQAVTTTSPVGTTNANAANWTTLADPNTIPPGPPRVTRVGFVRDTSVPAGQTVSGFKVTVEIDTTADTSVTIANVAQLFGESPNNIPVYDESGDNNPSNYNDDGTPQAGTDADNDKVPDVQPDGPDADTEPDFFPDNLIDDGFIADPADADEDGTPDANEPPGDVEIDTQNNNTGTGTQGEPNVFTITEQGDVSVLNGPKDNPDAVAENDNNKDFTNQSSLVPAGTTPGTGVDPDGVSFTNTVQNTGQAPADIVVEPTRPDPTTGAAPDLPDNTTVTVTYQSQQAVYTYTAANGFEITAGQTPVKIPQVAANATDNYGVEVNLPPGTALSTDPTDPNNPLNSPVEGGYPVPMRAFVDNDNDGNVDVDSNGNNAENITIDRVYVGYLQMVKETRVLKDDGPDVLAGDETFSTAPKKPAPGNVLEYRITYKNISEPQSGTGNIILDASDIVITEDGTDPTLGNNWALDNDGNGEIDTSNVVGSATDSNGANVEFTPNGDQSGTTQAADVTKYMVVVGDDVAPQEARTFIFQRKINATGQTGTSNNP